LLEKYQRLGSGPGCKNVVLITKYSLNRSQVCLFIIDNQNLMIHLVTFLPLVSIVAGSI